MVQPMLRVGRLAYVLASVCCQDADIGVLHALRIRQEYL